QGRTGWNWRHDRPRSLCLPDAAHVRRIDQLENGRPLAGPYVEGRVRSDKHRAGRAGAGRTCAGLDIPLCNRHRLRPVARRDLGCRMAASAWDCRAADPRPCAARPALFRDDAGHGYGNGWIVDTQAQSDPAEERDRPLHIRHRHVSDRQAYGSCWLITAGRERPSYARRRPSSEVGLGSKADLTVTGKGRPLEPQKRTFASRPQQVRFVPTSVVTRCSNTAESELLDDLVGGD